MNITVLWDVTPCILIERYQRFKESATTIFRVVQKIILILYLNMYDYLLKGKIPTLWKKSSCCAYFQEQFQCFSD
jgi:hypothetical protein